MSQFDDEIRMDALAMVNGLIAAAEQEEIDNAVGFVTLTTNDETHKISINGPFSNMIAALAWSVEHEAELNQGMGIDDAPFKVHVFPMMPTD
jgi:hypothetical protein